MPSRLSHLMTFTTSVICMSRLTLPLIRCERSPRPVSVGVKTLAAPGILPPAALVLPCTSWPRRSRRSDTRRQHQPRLARRRELTRRFLIDVAPGPWPPDRPKRPQPRRQLSRGALHLLRSAVSLFLPP